MLDANTIWIIGGVIGGIVGFFPGVLLLYLFGKIAVGETGGHVIYAYNNFGFILFVASIGGGAYFGVQGADWARLQFEIHTPQEKRLLGSWKLVRIICHPSRVRQDPYLLDETWTFDIYTLRRKLPNELKDLEYTWETLENSNLRLTGKNGQSHPEQFRYKTVSNKLIISLRGLLEIPDLADERRIEEFINGDLDTLLVLERRSK